MSGTNKQTYLAFDLGAESGRTFLGSLHNGALDIREIHRFANEPVEYAGTMHWDAPASGSKCAKPSPRSTPPRSQASE